MPLALKRTSTEPSACASTTWVGWNRQPSASSAPAGVTRRTTVCGASW